MSFLNRITSHIVNPRNLRQVILIAVGLLVLGAAILFGKDLEKLFNRPGASEASSRPPGSELAWQKIDPGLNNPRSGAELVDVNNGGQRYLYTIGGIEYSESTGELRLIDTVERMPLSAVGSPVSGVWEAMPLMNSGHANFKAFQHDHYLYVVAGDIHIPDVTDSTIDQPLPFSTIERLDLNDTIAGWKVMAKLGGVNFFPEIAVVGNQLHVVGGVYGIPYSVGKTNPYGGGYYDLKEPIMGQNDVNKWNEVYKNVPTVGTPGVSIGSGALGDNTVTGYHQVISGLANGASASSGVQAQQIPGVRIPTRVAITPNSATLMEGEEKQFRAVVYDQNNDFWTNLPADFTFDWSVNPGVSGDPGAGLIKSHNGDRMQFQASSGHPGVGPWNYPSAIKVTFHSGAGVITTLVASASISVVPRFTDYAAILSHNLLNGTIATTVSEHYILNLGATLSTAFTGELGINPSNTVTTDYIGEPISGTWSANKVCRIGHLRLYVMSSPAPFAYPVPQGRYGFGLIQQGNDLVAVGGASWFSPTFFAGFYQLNRTFWVVDDGLSPISIPKFGGGAGTQYTYVGNVGYKFTGTNAPWQGTNSNDAGANGGQSPTKDPRGNLPTTYALKDSSGVVKGRAFFGLGQLEGDTRGPEWLAVGGIMNESIHGGSGSIGWSILTTTARTEKFTADGWISQPDLYGDSDGSYGVKVFGIGNSAVAFGGQTTVKDSGQEDIGDNFHVPDYKRTASNKVGMLADGQWYTMANFGNDPNSVGNLIFPAAQMVDIGVTGQPHTVYLYQAGGASPRTDGKPINSNIVQAIGPFTYGGGGVIDWNKSYILIHSNSHPNLDPYKGEVPIVMADGSDYATATLYTNDSNGDPVLVPEGSAVTLFTVNDDYNSTPRSFHPAIKKADKPDWIEIIGTPAPNHGLWDETYADNFVFIDRGNNEDGNPDTTLGQAQFKISSQVASDPQIKLRVLAVNLISNYTMFSPFGGSPMIFDADGVPAVADSTVVAEPTEVVANDTEESTITVTLKDHNQTAVSGYKVKLESSRGAVDHFTPTPPIATTNSSGVAVFKVRSLKRGPAQIMAKVGKTDEMVNGDRAMVLPYVTVEFTAKITSLTPNSALQGQTGFDIAVVGAGTDWGNTGGLAGTHTTVDFIPPSTIAFSLKDTRYGSDIEHLHFPASPLAVVNFTLTAPGQNNKQVNLNITSGEGSIIGGAPGLTVTTDATGKADFSYRAGSIAGFVKITAQIVGGVSQELWLTSEEAISHPYDITVSVDDTNMADNTPKRVRAIVRAYGDIVKDATNIAFDSDDNGTFSSVSYDQATGVAEAMYTKDSAAGSAHIFASTDYYNTFIADRVLINKGGANNADITNGAVPVADATHLTVTNVSVGEHAPVGVWTFRVTVDHGAAGEVGIADVVEYPFTVDPYDPLTGPHIVSLSPSRGLRGETTTVTIVGASTHFNRTYSTIHFTPPPLAGYSTDITSVITTATPTQIVADVTIPAAAVAGMWDVSVTTTSANGSFNEVAAKPGEGDFFVGDESGYILDVRCDAPNNTLPRDGSAQTTITMFLGTMDDPLTGHISPVPNIDVELAKGTDAGTLNPVDDLGKTIVKTDANGLATATYKTDRGELGEFVTITATAIPVPGTTVSNFLKILKSVSAYEGFVVSASPNVLPLLGPAQSVLSFTGLPADFTGQVNFELNGNPKGSISGSPTRNTALYVADADRIPETVEFWAWATLPGIGNVRSNTAFIDVGLDQSKYQLVSVTATPSSVVAGDANTSTVVARLLYNNVPVNGWRIDFELSRGAFGDYVSPGHADTVNGNATVVFAPGPMAGNVQIIARPFGLSLAKDVQITKTASGIVDLTQSSMWAMPSHVPVSADGSQYSVVTVLLKNANGTPLANKSVTLSSSRTQDVIKKGNGDTGITDATDSTGRVRFRVSSNTISPTPSTITARFDDLSLTTKLTFDPATDLLAYHLDVTVPFQARDYDNEVWAFLKVKNSELENDVVINGFYIKTANTLGNKVTELNSAIVYLKPNTTYTMWVKGRYHLSRLSGDITTTNVAPAQPLAIDFTRNLGTPAVPTGLLIGDLLPNTHMVNGVSVPLPYHDNAVNVVDLPPLYTAWFQNADIPDFLYDHIINVADWLFWFSNYGNGSLGGPPPYNQRL